MLNYNQIGVIDDGINVAFYNNIPMLNNSIEIDINCNIKEYINNEIEYSHGTVCAAIISKYTKGAVINSVKIINKSNKTTGKQLIKAIEWCLENEIGIVNLSLGSTDINEKRDICKVINKAINKGMVIVAASSNDGKITYPSSFSNVIGVKTLEDNLEHEGYIYNCRSIEGVDILAPSIHKLKNYFEEEESLKCNSFAAPYITARAHSMINKSHEKQRPLDIKYMLFKRAENYEEIKEKNIIDQHLEWINKAFVFNIGFQKNLNIEIETYIFDIIEEVYMYEGDKWRALDVIEAWINRKNLDDFDTVIIKDFNNKEFNVDFFAKSLAKYHKGLVYINDFYENNKGLKVTYKNNIWFTSNRIFSEDEVEKNICINMPVILIIGENKQGITSILKLGEAFRFQGYRCGIYSDTSLGELYGIDYLPLKDIYSKDKSEDYRMKKCLNLNEIDLGIVFVGLNNLDKKYIEWIEESLENDIRIGIDRDLNDILDYDKEKYSIILCSKEEEEKSFSNDSCVIKDIENLYKCIIDIYK